MKGRPQEPADPNTLSAWIRKGKRHRGVEENNDCVLRSVVWADTLGLALIGKYGSTEAALEVWDRWNKRRRRRSTHKTYTQELSDLLDIPLEVVEKLACLKYEGAEATDILRMLREGEISF